MAVAPVSKGVDPQADFQGDINVNDKLPTSKVLEEVAELPVLDVNNKSCAFKSLYANNENGARRILICFVRHFFCGHCQEYIRTLGSSLPPSALSSLSPSTEIVVIGCGQPELIPMYVRETDCPYPVYADPTRQLYQKLGMTMTLSLGDRKPEYIQRSVLSASVHSIWQGLRSGRKMLSGGDFSQVGGEFVFEDGKVTWCHRMKNTRDHTEISEVKKQLGLDGEKPPVRKRWSTAGLGAGLGRRFNERRQSWGGSRSRDRNTEKGTEKASTPPPIDEVKEEGTQEDALKKLEGNGVVMDEKIGNGSTVNVGVDSSTNGIGNGLVTA